MIPKNDIVRQIYSIVFLRRIFSLFFPKSFASKVRKLLFNTGKKPELSEETRHNILEYYMEDIEQLEKLLSVNLNRWKR